MTTKFYKINAYEKNLQSRITEIIGEDILVLDSTIFFPEGGGQPFDLGTITSLPLKSVYEEGEKIFHKLSISDDAQRVKFFLLKVGDLVESELDWERRFDHMQRHCGEHILSGIFFRQYSAVNRGFHMGDEYMTIDLDMESISDSDLDTIELEANKVIWSNAPVTVTYYNNKEEASKLPLRKDLTIDADISIVRIGNLENPTDCVACCGTHPSFAGEVGLIKIYKAEKYKGMIRVYFDAGKRAILDYNQKNRIISELCKTFSATPTDLASKIASKIEKSEKIILDLKLFKEILIQKETDELIELVSLPSDSENYAQGNQEVAIGQIVIKEFENYSIDDLSYMSKILCKNSDHLYILVSIKDNIVLMEKSPESSVNTRDLGMVIKDYCKDKPFRGGGSKFSARVSFNDNNDLSDFLDEILDLL
jgi:alanyl-tRNA synthetase